MIVQLSENEIGALAALSDACGDGGVRRALSIAIAFATATHAQGRDAPALAALIEGRALASTAERSPNYPTLARLTPFPGFVVDKLRAAIDAAAAGTMSLNQALFVRNWFGCVVKAFESVTSSEFRRSAE